MLLELKNINKTYKPKNGVPVQALKDISLSFDDKGMVFVLGKSGSGKSTLLNLIGGLDFADSGEIVIDGKSSKDFKESDYDSYRNTYIGFVFQEYNVINEFTVGENVSLALELQSQKDNKEQIEEILKEVDLEGYADRKPNELSGGQKQRVAIARAIVKAPKIIMADEPTGALDSETGKAIFDTLKRLSQDRLVIVVSHDREFAETYGDRIIELADGMVINDEIKNVTDLHITDLQNTKTQLLKKSRLPYVRALSMGAKTLRCKRFRIVITILLCFLSFTAFGFADTMVSFNVEKTESLTFYQGNDNYVSFNSYIGDGYNLMYRGKVQDNEGRWCSLNDLDKIRKSTGLDFQGVIPLGIDIRFLNRELLFDESEIGYYKEYGQSTAMPASQQLFDTMGFKLYGKLPSDENEIVITKRCFDQIALAGIDAKNIDILPGEAGDIEDFLNKNIKIEWENGEYSIVGIVDTFADADGKFLNCSNSNPSIYNCTLRKYFGYGYHSLIYIHQSLYDNYIESKSHEDTTGFGRELYVNLSNVVRCNGVAKQDSLKYVDSIIWLDGKGNRRELAENEIIIGVDSAEMLWPGPQNDNMSAIIAERAKECGYNKSLFDNLITFKYMILNDFRYYGKSLIAYCEEAEKLPNDKLEIYKQYCKNNNYVFSDKELNAQVELGAVFNNYEYRFGYNTDFNILTERQWRFSYACYLSCKMSNDVVDGYVVGGYNENITGESCGKEVSTKNANKVFVENRIQNALVSMKQIDLNNEFYVLYSGSKLEDNATPSFVSTPKIVGIYYPKDDYPSDFVINDKIYNNSLNYEEIIFEYMIAPLSGNLKTKDIVNLITSLHYDTSEARNFYCNNPVYYESEYIAGTCYTFRDMFFVISAILGLFSILLLGNYIEQSISSKKNEIGILRALGAKKSDIVAIFINEGVIITFIILVLAFMGVGFATLAFNSLAPEMLGLTLDLKILNFSFRQIVVLLAVGFGTTAIASAIPLYKLSKKKPVDSIQDR